MQALTLKKIVASPIFFAVVAIWLLSRSSFAGYLSNFQDLSGRVAAAEAQRKTRSFSIDSDQGKISVVDIRTGSEFPAHYYDAQWRHSRCFRVGQCLERRTGANSGGRAKMSEQLSHSASPLFSV